jgi:hypothetical protein
MDEIRRGKFREEGDNRNDLMLTFCIFYSFHDTGKRLWGNTQIISKIAIV